MICCRHCTSAIEQCTDDCWPILLKLSPDQPSLAFINPPVPVKTKNVDFREGFTSMIYSFQSLMQLASNLGLPVEEGIFGFKPFAEVWVGRLAMGGFISSIVVSTSRAPAYLHTTSIPRFKSDRSCAL